MEASLHGPFDKSPKGEPNIYRNWSLKLLALPLLLAIALISFVVSHPEAARWIADAAEAEFVGSDSAPGAPSATRLANH